MQHGDDTTASSLAVTWAARARELNPADRRVANLVAATRDRHLMRQRRPQWYGTQFVRDGEHGPWRLYDIDTTRVTDDERRRHGVGSLDEQRRKAESMNRRPPTRQY